MLTKQGGIVAHLRFDMIAAYYSGVEGHPQKVMRELDITYKHATPQSIADQWWFWGCAIKEGTQLPDYLSILDVKPEDCVGFGLSPKDVEKITGDPYIEKEVAVKREPLNAQSKVYSEDDITIFFGGQEIKGFKLGDIITVGGE